MDSRIELRREFPSTVYNEVLARILAETAETDFYERVREPLGRAGRPHPSEPQNGHRNPKTPDGTAIARGRTKVLDANFLIDYLDGMEDAKAYYAASEGPDERWIVPAPAYAEVLVGVGNLPDGDVEQTIDALAWVEVYDIDASLAVVAGQIADEIRPEGPFLTGMDGLVAAVGRELDAPVVS